MTSKNSPEKDVEPSKLDGIQVRTPIGEFSNEEMLECSTCRRNTPPNRLDCVYCGARLELNENQKAVLKPVIRPPDENADATNIVFWGSREALSEEQVKLIAQLTRMEEDDIRRLTEVGSAVPLARGESGEAIQLAAARMRELGVNTGIYSDSEIEPDRSPHRLRGISVESDAELALILFNNDEVVRISVSDIELIVVGLALENKFEAKEKHKKKGLEKVLDTTEVSADQTIIDIYLKGRETAFRIQPTGFDFGFLGDEKAFIATENLKHTIRFLRKFAPDAPFDDSYGSVRSVLDRIWPVSETEETKGVKRKGFGTFEKTRVKTSSNLEQFAKYSSLQRKAMRKL